MKQSLEQLKLKRHISKVSDDVENLNLFTAGGNVQWYSYYGKQYGTIL